jgi:hypothetical protein
VAVAERCIKLENTLGTLETLQTIFNLKNNQLVAGDVWQSCHRNLK